MEARVRLGQRTPSAALTAFIIWTRRLIDKGEEEIGALQGKATVWLLKCISESPSHTLKAYKANPTNDALNCQ